MSRNVSRLLWSWFRFDWTTAALDFVRLFPFISSKCASGASLFYQFIHLQPPKVLSGWGVEQSHFPWRQRRQVVIFSLSLTQSQVERPRWRRRLYRFEEFVRKIWKTRDNKLIDRSCRNFPLTKRNNSVSMRSWDSNGNPLEASFVKKCISKSFGSSRRKHTFRRFFIFNSGIFPPNKGTRSTATAIQF